MTASSTSSIETGLPAHRGEEIDDRPMRNLHALGLARRAGSINDIRRAQCTDVNSRFVSALLNRLSFSVEADRVRGVVR